MEKVKYLSQKEFDKLPEYSTSVPTAQRVGNKWKRHNYVFTISGKEYNGGWIPQEAKLVEDRWYMGEYCKDPDDKDYILTKWYKIVISKTKLPPIFHL